MENKEKIINRLQEMLDRTYDAYQGYSKAADTANDKALKLYLFNVSLERKDNAVVLAEQITGLGGTPDESGTLKGAAHRTWLNLKAMMSSDTQEAILEECLRGEQALVDDYMSVLQEADLPRSIENILARQLGTVQARVKKLEELEELEVA